MKKITTILSPLVLLATTALAQDSTCILQPSCSQLGYTSSETDCGTQKVLRCPFDVSQVACVGGSSGAGGGSGELGDVIAIRIVVTSDNIGFVQFTYGGGNIVVDCGNGQISSGFASANNGKIICWYLNRGFYTVKLSGDFTYYGGHTSLQFSDNASCSNCINTELLKLDKTGIIKMTNLCLSSYTRGSIPPLPSTLKDTTRMFYYCSNLGGKIADFSEFPNLTTYTDMFASSGITQAQNPSWPSSAW